ncbi:MAG: hypothetical protein J3R72DRAFT_435614 [Linnemannia gamsii]|nr:MAG: hypothetical protein J3R72DRAFT_435614 [Linnemannia gamsii]
MWNTALRVLFSKYQCQSFNFSDTDNSNSNKGPLNSSRSSSSNRTRPETAAVAIPTVFDIPEVLGEILSYLDEPALRQSVVLVCRHWYLMSHPLLSVRDVVWDDTRSINNNKDVDKVLARIPGAFALSWYSRPDRKGGIEASEPWQKLVVAMRRNYDQECLRRRCRQEQQQERECNRTLEGAGGLVFQSLQKLELGGSIDLGLATATLLPLLPSLTILEMHTHDRCSASLGSVFLSCPRLEQLHVSSLSFGAVELSWSWIPFDHVDNNNKDKDRGNNDTSLQQQYQQQQQQQQLLPPSLPLRSLVLENTSVELSGLESMLSITPDLQELKLIQHSNRSRTNSPSLSNSNNININTFFPRLKDTLKRHRITLNSFHYSIDNEPLTAARLIEIREEICHPRKANHWSFWTPADLPLFVFQTLRVMPNVVTTLELHSSKIGRCPMTGCKLHQYLCDSPHLLHLKAPRTAFLVDHFDIHHLVDATIAAHDAADTVAPTVHAPLSLSATGSGTVTGAGAGVGTMAASTSTTIPPIWKCRNLRTLHMSFRCSRSNYPSTIPLLHLRTRILFGYISRVCPELRDLRIDTSFMDSANYDVHEAKMYLAFEGGFCLLSRLHFLERLSIDAVCRRVFYSPWELTWMLGDEEVDREEKVVERKRIMIDRVEQQRTASERRDWAVLHGRPSRVSIAAAVPSRFSSCNTCGTKTGRLRSKDNTDTDTDADDDNDERDVRLLLENLGQLQEIVEVMEELDELDAEADTEGEEGTGKRKRRSRKVVKYCWPHLQKIALFRPNRYGLSRREEAIEQLVPDSLFQMLVRRTFY